MGDKNQPLLIEEDGVLEGPVNTVNFTGSGVSVAITDGKATVTITGGGGGGSSFGYFPQGWS